MTGADLEWTEVEVSPLGLNESIDARALPPGQLTQVVNCEFSSKAGSVRKRPGLIKISDPPQDLGSGSLGLSRLITHEGKNQLLAVDLNGSELAAPALYSIINATSDGTESQLPKRAGFATNALMRRYPLATDLQSDISADVAFVRTSHDHGYLVYGMVAAQTGNISVKVVQVKTEGIDWEPDHTVIDMDIPYSRSNGTAYWVRAAAWNDEQVMLSWQHDSGRIYALVVDCETSSTPTVGSLVLITNAAALDATLDASGHIVSTHDTIGTTDTGAPAWYFSLILDASQSPQVRKHDGSLVIDWFANTGDTLTTTTAIYEKDGLVWLNWYQTDADGEPPEPGWRYAVYNASTGAVVLAETIWCDGGDVGTDEILASGWKAAIAFNPEDTTSAIMFHSQHHTRRTDALEPYGFWDRPTTRWRLVNDNGSMNGLRQKRGPNLLSKPWPDATVGWYWAWTFMEVIPQLGVRSATALLGQQIHAYDRTAVLMKFSEADAAEDSFATASPMGSSAGLAVGDVYAALEEDSAFTLNNLEPGAPQPQSITYQQFTQSTAARIGRRTVFNIRYVPTESKSAPWDMVVRVNEEQSTFPQGFGRYTSKMFGGSVYMAGGLLTQWDGDRHHENGYLTPPNLQITTDDGAGSGWPTAWAEKTVFAQAVYESVLENGERVRSATSNVASLLLSGTDGSVAPTDLLTFWLEPMTVSMRTYGGSNQEYQTPRTIVTLYLSSAPDSTTLNRAYEFVLYDWEQFVSNPDSLVPITVDFDGIDFGAAATTRRQDNEVIYNDSGELDNDHPYGGCASIEVHKDRLWAASNDDPEVVYYSKERVEGRPAEFALGQSIRLPSSRVVAIASLNDALIVLCERAIFAVFGEGPNALGDPSSGFFTIVPVSTSIGCTSPIVTTTQNGVLFKSDKDYALVDRGRNVQIIGAPVQDTAALTNSPLSASIAFNDYQIRLPISYSIADEDASDVLVYDWVADKWATWRYKFAELPESTPPFGAVLDYAQLGRNLYAVTNQGFVYREDPEVFADDGNSYRQKLEFGWLSFGRVQGYKRLHKMGILKNPNPWNNYSANPKTFPYGFKVSLDYNYDERFSTTVHQWSSTQIGEIAPRDGLSWLRVHVGKKQPSLRVILEETEPVKRLIGTVTTATVNTVGANVFSVRADSGDPFTDITLTSGAAVPMDTIIAEVQAGIEAASLDSLILCYKDSTGALVVETLYGTYVEVDSIAGGSTANTPLGFAVGGAIGALVVSPANQSGFILQSLAFEVGQTRGLRRLPAAQGR